MKKVLVTGANGLLGSHVVRELLSKKYNVRVLARKGSDLRALHNLNVEIHFGQITIGKDIMNAVNGCNYVIHVAARTSQAPADLKFYLKPNIESTKNIIKACKQFNIKRLVFVSSANCFGNGTKEKPGNENCSFLPWLKHSGYAYSKFLAQQIVLKEAKENNLAAVIVSPTFIIGARDYKPSSGQIFSHVLNKQIAFCPPGGKNFVDANMAASGIVSAMQKGKIGECYLLAGENHSYLEFFRMVNEAAEQKTRFVPVPKLLLLFAGFCGGLFGKIFRRPVQLTLTNARMLCLGNYFSAQKAFSALDFQLVPTRKSVEKAISWFRSNDFFLPKKQ